MFEAVSKRVNEFPTRHPAVMSEAEINSLLEDWDEVSRDAFEIHMGGSTGVIYETYYYYKDDIILAITCALEDREIMPHEWD